MDTKTIDHHIERILSRLKKLQKADGSWSDANFINALVAYSIACMRPSIPHGSKKRVEKIKIILIKSANYILSERSSVWTWNYYSAKNKKHIYPHDLDDTFCSLIALHTIRPIFINNEVLGHITALLKKTESSEGGPFQTWITSGNDAHWDDIDPAVNANIAYFLLLKNIDSPRLTGYLETIIHSKNFKSRYYDNPLFVTYFLARGYTGKQRKSLVSFIFEQINLTKNSTHRALGVCALLRLKTPLVRIEKYLPSIEIETDDNLYIEKITNGKIVYAQSEAFSYAIKGEMYALYRGCRVEAEKMRKTKDKNNYEKSNIEMARMEIQKRLGTLPPLLQAEAMRIFSKTLQTKSGRTIAALPFQIAWGIAGQDFVQHISSVVTCSMVSIYGWAAYSIYDDIIDTGKKTSSTLLPVATVFHREMCRTISGLVGRSSNDPGTLAFNTLEIFDSAIYEDMKKYRFDLNRVPSYIRLPSIRLTIEKSIGYMMPSILLYTLLQKSDVNYFIQFFRNFIFVRQLSDDIRDWREDMSKGIITRVTGRILIIWKTFPCTQLSIDLERDWRIFEKIFLQQVLTTASVEIGKYVQKAEESLDHLTQFRDKEFFIEMLRPYKEIARKYGIIS